MSTQRRQFAAFSRLAALDDGRDVLTMLCVGVAMFVSLANYHVLVSIHRPLGIAILILVVIRFVNRLLIRLRLFRPRCCERSVWRQRRPNSRCMSDVRSSAGRLGNAVGSALIRSSSWIVHLPFILPHSACCSGAAEGAHDPRVLFFLMFVVTLGRSLFHALIVGTECSSGMAPWKHSAEEGLNTD